MPNGRAIEYGFFAGGSGWAPSSARISSLADPMDLASAFPPLQSHLPLASHEMASAAPDD